MTRSSREARSGQKEGVSRPDLEIGDLETLADWMDSRFRIPGTGIRFGLDALFGIVPGVGDGLLTLPGVYILVRAHRLGAPFLLLARMAGNLAIDLVVGVIPLVGDIFDIGFRANRRNVALLRAHFDKTARASGTAPDR
ncbi:MAG: DUF4112 domain-containing protein [Thalassobaculaceae bacterium]|nr:DUF4112 domain-containing protein [Thalassobaculaceae bacterium]